MARIVSSLLHRPHADKSKRALRIPVGGHTEKTILRGQTQDLMVIDEVAFFPKVAAEPVIFEAATPEEIVEPAPGEDLVEEAPVVEEQETIAGVEVSAEEVAAELGTEEELAAAEARVDEHNTEVPPAVDPEVVTPEEVVLEKFDYAAFLTQKPAEIKTALATGEHDHHLAALTEAETAGAARKTVLGYIAGRVKV